MKGIFKRVAVFVLLAAFAFSAFGCNVTDGGSGTRKLAVPADVKVNKAEKTLTWTAVENASGYKVSVAKSGSDASKLVSVTDAAYDLAPLTPGAYTLKVRASGGEGADYADSDWSGAVSYDAPEQDGLADGVYTFSSGLPSESPVYPQSVGVKYYIAANGAAQNDGRSEQAPKRLADVQNINFVPGVSVLFKRGDTFGALNLSAVSIAGSDTNPITFASYGEGEKPLFESEAGRALSFSKCSNVVVRDLCVDITGNEILNNYELNDVCEGIAFDYQYAGANKYKNVYIVNNEVRGNGTTKNIVGIQVQSLETVFASCPSEVLTGLYILGNTVHNVGRSGIRVAGWLSGNQVNNGKLDVFKNFKFDGNTVYDVGQIGMYIVCGTDGTMNRNLVYNTGRLPKEKNINIEGVCGIMALCADSVDIMYNESYGNAGTTVDAMAIDIDWNTTNIDVRYNHAYNNEGCGIGTMANQNSFIRDNRIENNDAGTNQDAQLTVGDYTIRDEPVGIADGMFAVTNLKITNNLVIGTPDGKAMFRAYHHYGDITWTGNEFSGNRMVYNGSAPDTVKYVEVVTAAPWHTFANNRYYAIDTSVFKCTDANAGTPYVADSTTFAAWLLRDAGSTFTAYSAAAPAKPVISDVKFEDGDLKLSWQKPSGDVWHYNVYVAVAANKTVDYRDLSGQTEAENFSFKPGHKGVYYITVRPESNTGVYGADLKITVTLK
ncbi:MAG: right-handed parallel beta-helix repeat-containing protein [Clostridiales bacterium]|jgi:hypothetical protein|nr:right-handed parallel beta-helix repeat-containing protein [Clostridiales bacterium]